MILRCWALHPHSEDDWLQGCSVEEDSCLENLSQDVVKGDDSQPCADVGEQSWIEVLSGFCRDNTVTFLLQFSSLSVEYASLDPEDADLHDVVIERSHIQFTSASSQGAVMIEKVGPTDLELLYADSSEWPKQHRKHKYQLTSSGQSPLSWFTQTWSSNFGMHVT